MRYLNTLVRFSQVDGSTGCIDAHVRAIGKRFSQEQVDVMIGQYEYL